MQAKAPPEVYDFAVAWEWEYDKEFIERLSSTCLNDTLSFYAVHPRNFHEVSQKVDEGRLFFRAFLDRAGDTLEHFARFNERLKSRGTWVINHLNNIERSRDKATMHLEFLTKGLYVPFTVILSPYEKDPELRISELEKLGRPFIIKPACGGGGIGVVMGAENLMDVIVARKEFHQDKYLLQRKVAPKILGTRRAWFRCFYVCGNVISCWWDDQTHIYEVITPEERAKYRLFKFRDIVKAIAEVADLNFFSTEIALDSAIEKLTVVDYVNEPCDMRLKSVHPDGVPDEIVRDVVSSLLSGVKAEIKKNPRKLSK